MKKKIPLAVLSLLTAMGMTACSNPSESAPKEDSANPAETAAMQASAERVTEKMAKTDDAANSSAEATAEASQEISSEEHFLSEGPSVETVLLEDSFSVSEKDASTEPTNSLESVTSEETTLSQSETDASENTDTAAASANLPLPYPAQLLPESEGSLYSLRWQLAKLLSEYDGNWSVYAKNLDTDEALLVNDISMNSASLMKLFVMGTVYQAIEDGQLERTSEIVSRMAAMISNSSNGDTNQLLSLLGDGRYQKGIAKVNDYIRSQGYSSLTHEYNGFQDNATILDPEHHNVVAAKDCGLLLERIYRRTFGSRQVCNEVEEWMLHQATRYKIPAAIDGEVQIGNKTGEMDDTENDAAIVYAKECDFILVILSNSWSNRDAAQNHIHEITEMVYHFLIGQDSYETFVPVPAGIYLVDSVDRTDLDRRAFHDVLAQALARSQAESQVSANDTAITEAAPQTETEPLAETESAPTIAETPSDDSQEAIQEQLRQKASETLQNLFARP